MTTQLIAQQHVLVAGYRFTGQIRGLNEHNDTAKLDATTLGNMTRIYAPGLRDYGIAFDGLFSASYDLELHSLFRASNVPLTIALTDGSVGSPARSLEAATWDYKLGGKTGELMEMSFGAGVTRYGPVPGNILYNTSGTGNITGTAVQLGAILSTQSLYGALHVISGTGSFIVKIQSASDQAFTSPNDRITFATVATGTPAASEFATPVAGAITDTWWRAVATNPNTRDFTVFAGIQ